MYLQELTNKWIFFGHYPFWVHLLLFQSILSNGGSIDIPIRQNSGHGHNLDTILRMDLSFSGNVELMDCAGWFERIEFLSPEGTRIQILYEDDLRRR